MKKLYGLIIITCLAISVVLVIHISRPATPLSVAYTLRSRVTEYDPAGNLVSEHDETRYVSTNGNWREVKTYPDGRQMPELVGDYERQAVFAVKNNALVRLSDYNGRPNQTRERLMQSSSFGGESNILGYEVLIERNGPQTTYIAPALDWQVLKREFSHPDGTFLVVEPTSIEIGEPSAEALNYHREWPVISR
ncbi:MAG TPA: hypothetical protein VK619_04865 [Pyrinomonadaceae bacterium]|nr:hypothetical protein [Pyrinomonadaceae bacterium]